jgi:two-component system cell cycle response regulator
MGSEIATNVFPRPLTGAVAHIPEPLARPVPPLRMVVADDSILSLTMMQHLLGKLGFDPQVARDGASAWELLQAEDVPTIAILDWMMPGMEGIDICRKIRQLSHQHYTYAMLLTGKSEKKEIIEGLQAGADDYMTKPINVDELQARLVVAQRIINFQEELFTAREVLRNQASHDYLTQLLNRGGIMEAVQQELSRSRRTGESFSVILVDIDHFKQINDTFGHLTGDDVLFEVASRIKTCTRSYDSVGRYGGEEFLLVVPGCDQSQAFQVAEKIRQSVCQTPIQMSQAEKTVTISLGVCTRTVETGPDALLMAADSALYCAKKSGRNRSEVGSSIATPEMRS